MMNQQQQRLQLGMARCKVRRRIQEHLDNLGLNCARVAERAGVTTPAVLRTVRGDLHSPRVLQALRELGVPERYLFDPSQIGTGDTQPEPCNCK